MKRKYPVRIFSTHYKVLPFFWLKVLHVHISRRNWSMRMKNILLLFVYFPVTRTGGRGEKNTTSISTREKFYGLYNFVKCLHISYFFVIFLCIFLKHTTRPRTRIQKSKRGRHFRICAAISNPRRT